jgi:mono/diheme cytochrome c family protein
MEMKDVMPSRRLLTAAAMVLMTLATPAALAADEPAKPAEAAAPAAGEAAKPAEAAAPAASAAQPAAVPSKVAPSGETRSPLELVNAVEKGKLKNPYTDNPDAIAEGKKLYMGNSCNGCHGGGGGGGMCPSLTNETWVYGSDDDTLFRLITLGSANLKSQQGFTAIAKETVTGPMPGYQDIITDTDKLWKIIAWMRTVFKGRPEKRDW